MRKHRSILLVDDDPAVLDSTKQILTQRGYSVFNAEHLDDAIEILRDFSISIDILVADFNIGKMNGVDLSRLAFLLRPRLEILFVSGNPGSQASLRKREHFLPKPFTSLELHQKLDSLFREAKPSFGSPSLGHFDT